MDPNETLKELRELIDLVLRGDDTSVFEAATKFEDLDEWISKGGFLPEAWNRRGR